MYQFPEGLYADVRLEDVSKTIISYENFKLEQNQATREQGAFIRVFDGKRWYYSATTDLDSIQAELNSLAEMAVVNPNIASDPVVSCMEINQDVCLRYQDNNVQKILHTDKLALLDEYQPLLKQFSEISVCTATYQDTHTEKRFYSSLGADIHYDYQCASVILRYTFTVGDAPFSSVVHSYQEEFKDLTGHQERMKKEMEEELLYAKEAVPVVSGTYTCVLSPSTTGVFAHESFGHKSEADFMLGSEAMLKEWAIGSKVGASLLNIIDTGIPTGSGYVPYDDEGTKAKQNYLIKDGILAGRLHSASTAAALGERVTGNARAKDFSFEPIVRMTQTYIDGGDLMLDELLAPIETGIYIKDINHGSGMSTFTIAPSVAYMIRNGKLAEPVRISVITGNVMQTLHEIDGLTKDAVCEPRSTGGCGKMEQYPLRVGFGGPYVRVNHIQVQ